MPLPISVVIPTLHREEPLVALLRYLLEEEKHQPLEILVVDQSETHLPETETYLRSIQDRIRYFRVDFKGTTKAKNLGIRHASHPILLFFDDDSTPTPGCVRAHAEAHLEKNLAGVCGPSRTPGQKLLTMNEVPPAQLRQMLNGTQARFDVNFRYFACYAVCANVSFKKEWIEKVGYFDEVFFGSAVGEDAEFSNRILLHGGKILYDPATAVLNLMYPTGGSRNERHPGLAILDYVENAHYYWCKIGLPRRHRVKTWTLMIWNSVRDRRTRTALGVWGVFSYYWKAISQSVFKHRGVRPNFATIQSS